MASSGPDQERTFLPSMLRKNGGKFSDGMCNALMNKFKLPDDFRKSIQQIQAEESIESSELQLAHSENLSADAKATFDCILRRKILQDVRSTRVRPPSTRRKSNIFKEQLTSTAIPLESKTVEKLPTKTSSSPKEEKKLFYESKFIVKIDNDTSEIVRRQFPRNRSERPLSVGNLEAFRSIITTENNTSDDRKINEVDCTTSGKKLITTALKLSNLSKSTEVLTTSPSSATSTTSISEKQINLSSKSKIHDLKTLAVNLDASVKAMEKEISSVKEYLSNLINVLAEIEPDDKN